MRIDRYAKTMLTIIAASSIWLSLGGSHLMSTVLAQAQSKRPFPTVITGSDFGFRVNRWSVGQPIVGTLLVQVNGEWREVQADPKVTPAVSAP
jgi:hypothetical protein